MTQRSYLDILGLDAPPKDRREVKRAYSKRLKEVRPDEDPEGFMALRDAHDFALDRLSWNVPEDAASLTYEDLVPAELESFSEEEKEDTSYAIGPAPTVVPAEPRDPPMLDDIYALLSTPEMMNDRNRWNDLYNRARRLDIDDYTDFENALLEALLRIHGFYDDDNDRFDTPERMPALLTPTIAASVHKTMGFDKVGHADRRLQYKVDWLTRRLNLRAPLKTPMGEVTDGATNMMGWVWGFLIAAFVLAKFLIAIVE